MLNKYWICGGIWSVFFGIKMCKLRRSIITDSHFKHIQCFLKDDVGGTKSGAGIEIYWQMEGTILYAGGLFLNYLFWIVHSHILVFRLLTCFYTCFYRIRQVRGVI